MRLFTSPCISYPSCVQPVPPCTVPTRASTPYPPSGSVGAVMAPITARCDAVCNTTGRSCLFFRSSKGFLPRPAISHLFCLHTYAARYTTYQADFDRYIQTSNVTLVSNYACMYRAQAPAEPCRPARLELVKPPNQQMILGTVFERG